VHLAAYDALMQQKSLDSTLVPEFLYKNKFAKSWMLVAFANYSFFGII
jgi:hypothetical protein